MPSGRAVIRASSSGTSRRLGDAGHTAFIELLKEGETKPKREKQQPAPGPGRERISLE